MANSVELFTQKGGADMSYLSRTNDIFSNLSLFIKISHFVHHDSTWHETKTPTIHTLWNVYKGNIWVSINGETYRAGPGDSILFYPGNKYSAWSDEDGCFFHFIMFSLEKGNHINILTGENLAGIYRSEKMNARCLRFCQNHLRDYFGKNTTSMKFYSFCFDFLADLLDPPECTIHFFADNQTNEDLLIHRIADYMNDHFAADVRIRDIAREVGMSEKYFIRYFRKNFNISPKQYMIELRMKFALELLMNTEVSIAEIAEKLGYSDPYSFSKAFRKFYNDSPTVIRRYTLR